MRRRLLTVLSVLLLVTALHASPAEARDFNLSFVPGKSYGVVSGAVIRGERDNYVFGARPGQFISVAVMSAEDNAVVELSIRQFGAWVTLDDQYETRTLYGELPESEGGQYRLSVGGTRGNATYDMFVGISAVGP
ncbi:MAG: hypothetical protein IT306_30445 [Chloroflexi bacterium]|nr:hypothetical protein [Chloroflexota bacterium]